MTLLRLSALACLALRLVAGAPAYAQAQSADCAPIDGVDFVCGPTNAEDLVLAPGTDWIISSGMAAGAGFYLIDAASADWRPMGFTADHDASLYPACAEAPDVAHLESHGLHIRSLDAGRSRLSVVGHGAREAIEIFDFATGGAAPALTWRGCVPMPAGLAANSVASTADGSLYATVLLMPGTTFADAVAMKPTGFVYAWSPGDDGFTQVAGTSLPSNNGIEVAADGSELYVASSGFQTIVAFSNTNPARQLRTTAQLPITPDNVHWGEDGRLLTAGMANDVPECGGAPSPEHSLELLGSCPRGSIAIAVDPATMATEIIATTPRNPAFSNATMVLTHNGRFWIGTFSGSRIAHGEL